MTLNVSVKKFAATLKRHSVSFAACAFIALAVVGSLLSASCAHSPAGLQRETAVYLATSNAVSSLNAAVPYVPPPANAFVQALLAAGAALLAVWATHLQRSLKELRNGHSAGSPPDGPAPVSGSPP